MKTSSADNTQHPEAGSGRTRASRAHSLRFGAAAVLVLLGTFAGLTVAGVTPAGASTIDGVANLAQPGSDARMLVGQLGHQLHRDPAAGRHRPGQVHGQHRAVAAITCTATCCTGASSRPR